MSSRHHAAMDWQRFGADDPYFGVLSDPRFRGREIEEAVRDEFFKSGQVHVERLIGALNEHFGDIPRGKALDFGCGVGRLAQALARHFAEVVGLDISPGMLAEARRNAVASGFKNLEYHSSLQPEHLLPRSYDLVHSYIVLQHIPVETGEPIIAKLIDAVNEGGVGALHLTISPTKGRLKGAVRNRIKRSRVGRTIANIALRRRWNTPAMEMNQYRVERIIEILAQSGIHKFACLRIDDWGDVGLFVLFRRSSGADGIPPWSNPVR